MRIDMREPVQLGESARRIPVRAARTGRVYKPDAEVAIRSGGPAGALFARLAGRGKMLRVWLEYPVDRFDEAIGRQTKVLGAAR